MISTTTLPNISNYNLPDIQLFEQEEDRVLIWIPDKMYIVLGASNNATDALIIENVIRDNLEVLKRPSGGQTVILSPQNIIISAIISDGRIIHPKAIFNHFNNLIIDLLHKEGLTSLHGKGISDIACGEKKIMGSAIYRNKDRMLYHAVLNYGESASVFEQYLKHPSKEPDYRLGRSHSNFVTSLKELGYTKDIFHLKEALSDLLMKK